ncbi:uncharacterized protein LOC104417041 [Eucalyptus grandis]|uniref:uncharacterized protein LOC104417041 n=1 Tax=Eucalyptus grandis TaxID=71139 RepID=UPI00192F02AC|nr:uncharacterized protein LOC104417041 [Eucalyptus grandis]
MGKVAGAPVRTRGGRRRQQQRPAGKGGGAARQRLATCVTRRGGSTADSSGLAALQQSAEARRSRGGGAAAARDLLASGTAASGVSVAIGSDELLQGCARGSAGALVPSRRRSRDSGRGRGNSDGGAELRTVAGRYGERRLLVSDCSSGDARTRGDLGSRSGTANLGRGAVATSGARSSGGRQSGSGGTAADSGERR